MYWFQDKGVLTDSRFPSWLESFPINDFYPNFYVFNLEKITKFSIDSNYLIQREWSLLIDLIPKSNESMKIIDQIQREFVLKFDFDPNINIEEILIETRKQGWIPTTD